eukprot:Em0022g42a
MEGVHIISARETLVLFLKSLPQGSFFNVIGFGSDYIPLFESSRPYEQENVDLAEKYANDMEASLGETELLPPLKHIFGQDAVPGAYRQVFVITDGAVSNTHDCVELVKRNAHHSRCFTVGIGSGASTVLVEGLAKAGNGTAGVCEGRREDRARAGSRARAWVRRLSPARWFPGAGLGSRARLGSRSSAGVPGAGVFPGAGLGSRSRLSRRAAGVPGRGLGSRARGWVPGRGAGVPGRGAGSGAPLGSLRGPGVPGRAAGSRALVWVPGAGLGSRARGSFPGARLGSGCGVWFPGAGLVPGRACPRPAAGVPGRGAGFPGAGLGSRARGWVPGAGLGFPGEGLGSRSGDGSPGEGMGLPACGVTYSVGRANYYGNQKPQVCHAPAVTNPSVEFRHNTRSVYVLHGPISLPPIFNGHSVDSRAASPNYPPPCSQAIIRDWESLQEDQQKIVKGTVLPKAKKNHRLKEVAVCMVSDDSPVTTKQVNWSGMLYEVVKLQRIDGSWSFDDHLATVLGKKREELKEACPVECLVPWRRWDFRSSCGQPLHELIEGTGHTGVQGTPNGVVIGRDSRSKGAAMFTSMTIRGAKCHVASMVSKHIT